MTLMWDIIELFIIAVVLWFMVTQVFLPVFRGTKMYPIFRTKMPKLNAELTDVRQQGAEKDLKEEIRRAKKGI